MDSFDKKLRDVCKRKAYKKGTDKAPQYALFVNRQV